MQSMLIAIALDAHRAELQREAARRRRAPVRRRGFTRIR